MANETNQAAPQPALIAQPSGVTEKTGAANSTVSSFAQTLIRKEEARAAEQASAKELVPEVPATATEESASIAPEETQVPEAEATTETTAEADKPAETETEETADEVLSHETKLDPKIQEKINKRIGREVVKRKALEAEVEQLRKQVMAPPEEKITSVTVPVPANMPLADVPDLTGLNEVVRQAKAAQRAAEELLDRDDINDGVQVGDRKYSKAELKGIVRDTRITLEDHVPMREKFLTDQQSARQKTLEEFPYLRNRASPEYMEHQAALKANPWLLAQPNADWIVAVQLRGVKAIEAEKAAAKKPADKKATVKPKPTGDHAVVTSDASASRVPAGTLNNQARQAASKVLEGKRGVGAKDFAEYLRQNEISKLSR